MIVGIYLFLGMCGALLILGAFSAVVLTAIVAFKIARVVQRIRVRWIRRLVLPTMRVERWRR